MEKHLLSEEEKVYLKNKKATMLKALVLLEGALNEEEISKNFYLRLKSGIDYIVCDCIKKLKEEQNISLLTSQKTFEKMAKISKISKIDKNDLKVLTFIKQEAEMLEKFAKHIEEQKKFTKNDFLKLIELQQSIDERIFKTNN